MVELTLSDVLTQAFERASALDVPLADRLQAFAESVRLASPPFADAADRMINRLQQNGSGANAPKVGEVMPSFILPDDRGHLVSLDMLLERGPVAISFHRGHWCPYCRLNTSALAAAQCEVEPLGGQIVAITPDLRRFTTMMRVEGAQRTISDPDRYRQRLRHVTQPDHLRRAGHDKLHERRRLGHCAVPGQRFLDASHSGDIYRRV